MTLLQSWADSLTLLKPKNFQLFLMVTVKSIIEAYKIYVRYFWWALLLVTVGGLASCFLSFAQIFPYRHISFYSSSFLCEILFLAACLSTRPSVLLKDGDYFIFQLKKIILFWIFLPLFSWSSATYYGYIFAVLFFADSEGGCKNFLLSLWNALKMVFFNVPLMVILGGFMYALGWFGGYYLHQLCLAYNIPIYPQYYLLFNAVGALLLPIGVCFYTNIYIKRLHDQFDLYFRKT